MIKKLVLTAAILFITYLFIGLFLPFSLFVNVSEFSADDVCVGSDIVTYNSERTPVWGILGESYSQIVRFEDQLKYETTIERGSVSDPVSFGYEANTTGATYETRWSEPFLNEGTYGANEWIKIHPLPFIVVPKFNPAEDAKFNVINCNYEPMGKILATSTTAG